MGKHSQKWFFWHSVLFIFIMRQSYICAFVYLCIWIIVLFTIWKMNVVNIDRCICVFLHPLGLSSTILTWCCLDKLCKLRWDYTAPNLSNINIQQMDGIHFSYINHRAKKTWKKAGNGSIFSFSLTTSTFTHGSHPMESTLYRTENIIARSFIFSSSAEFSALFAFIVVSCLWGKF